MSAQPLTEMASADCLVIASYAPEWHGNSPTFRRAWRRTETMCMTRSNWASWVQAIGAILAVAAALAIVGWELGNRQRERAVDEVRRLQVLWTFAYSLPRRDAVCEGYLGRRLWACGRRAGRWATCTHVVHGPGQRRSGASFTCPQPAREPTPRRCVAESLAWPSQRSAVLPWSLPWSPSGPCCRS